MMRMLLLAVLAATLAGCASVQNRHPNYGADCDALVEEGTPVDCVRVFFGTNRQLLTEYGSGPETDVTQSTALNAGALLTGRADIWLPKLIEDGGTREVGETPLLKGEIPENENELVKYVFVTRITQSGREYFVGQMKDALGDHNNTALVFVHGFNVEFENALIRSAQLTVDLSQNAVLEPGAPILFSWPSAGKMSLGNYRRDQDAAVDAVPYLEEFLDLITERTGVQQVNIIAHSMGNRVLVRALERYAADYRERFPDRFIDFRIILAAADVDSDLFRDIAETWDNLQPRVTIYTSDDDVALKVSKLVNGGARLGDTNVNKPFIRTVPDYETVDATPVASELFGLGHSYYSDNPFILGDILCALTGAPPNDRSLRARNYDDQPTEPEFYQTQDGIAPFYEECSLRRQLIPNDDPNIRIIERTGSGMGAVRPPQREIEPIIIVPPPAPAPAAPLEDFEQAIYFETGSSEISPAQLEALEWLIDEVLNTPGVSQIIIEGHADSTGSQTYNDRLSKKRAEAVESLFLSAGIPKALIEVQVYGEDRPQVPLPDGTPDALNRRVVVRVTFR